MNNIETAVRRAAPVVALVITAALLLAELAYRLGFLLGRAVHDRNDQLAKAMVRLVARPPIAAATVTAAPAVHPLAELAADLEQLSNRQLQAITGCRRRVAKQQLVALALAW